MLLEQFPLREIPIGKGGFRSKLLKNYVETENTSLNHSRLRSN